MTLRFNTTAELIESVNNEQKEALKNGVSTNKHLLTFRKNDLIMQIHSTNPDEINVYEIDLETIVDARSLLGWILHLHGKRWEGDNEVIHAFLTLLNYVIASYFQNSLSLDDINYRGAVLNWAKKTATNTDR